MSQQANIPAQNLEAEEHVLGAMLMSPVAVDKASEILKPDDFYRESHGAVFAACLALASEGVAVDAITVIDRLEERKELEKVGGRTKVHELANIVPSTANAAHYARIVREMSVLRRLSVAGLRLVEMGRERGDETDELVEEAEQLVYALRGENRRGQFSPIRGAVENTMRRLQELHEAGATVTGVPSGFRRLDEMTSGWQVGDLIILAARPSMGKTGLALGAAGHAAIHLGLPVGIFSLEMGQEQIVQRLIGIESSVNIHRLRTGSLSLEEWNRVNDASSRIAAAPLYVDDSGALTLLELRSKARRLKGRHPELALLIIDYLQLMGSGTQFDNRVQEVSQISRGLKLLARELEMPILALSQLSRAPEQRHDKRPMLSDLRDSGSLEQDADIVAFLYRDEYYNPEDTENQGIAELNIAKHRNGPTDTVKLSFTKRYARFTDLHMSGDVAGMAQS